MASICGLGLVVGNPVTVCWQKGVVGGVITEVRAEYVLRQTAARRQRMDVVDDRQNVASLLSGHQDLTPNSDACAWTPQLCLFELVFLLSFRNFYFYFLYFMHHVF